MSHTQDSARSLAGLLVVSAIAAPTVLGVYPVRLALVGLGFGPAPWMAACWQMASVVTWALLAIPLLQRFRQVADANMATGRAALALPYDGPAIAPALFLAIAIHAAALASASEILLLGRGRPVLPLLALTIGLLYAPMNVMTALGLIGAAVVSAEHRARLREATLRHQLERQLADARHQVLTALAELNGPRRPALATRAASPLERIAVTVGDRTTLIAVEDIDWIEARSYYARLHVGARHFLVRRSMNALERRLDPNRFARIHRSTIVNLDRVTRLQPLDRRNYVVILRDGRRLVMSRRRRRLLDFLRP